MTPAELAHIRAHAAATTTVDGRLFWEAAPGYVVMLLAHIDATPAVTVGGGEVEKAHQWLTYLAGINDQAGSLKAADECRQWSDLLTRLSAKLQSGDNGAGCARRRGREP